MSVKHNKVFHRVQNENGEITVRFQYDTGLATPEMGSIFELLKRLGNGEKIPSDEICAALLKCGFQDATAEPPKPAKGSC